MSDWQIPAERPARDTTRHPAISTMVLPSILLAAYLAQCAWFIQTQSFTIDEPIDIMSGLEQWRTGQYSGGLGWNDHPPLARLLCTLPAIASRFQIINTPADAPKNYPTGTRKLVLPDPEAMAWHTRPVDAVLGAILGLLLWLAARSSFSTGAANFVLALFAFSPSLIAHFSLAATNDGVIALALFAAVFQLCRWRHDPSWPQTALLGLALGGLLISKTSSLPFFAIAIVLMLLLTRDSITIRAVRRNWKQAATALFVSFLIVWGSYRFHISKLTLTASDVRMSIAIPKRPDPIIYHPSRSFHISIPIPAYEFVQGIGFQLKHDSEGHPGFLLGRSYIGGSKLYFPVVILLKWPTIVLLLCASAVVLIFLRRSQRLRDSVLWMSFPVVYFALAEFARINIGERYILPIYPFALLLCGSLWQFTTGRRRVLMLLLGALALHAADVLRYAPDYLSYFSPFVDPANSYRLLSDSNVDWGEGLIALRHYQQAHPRVTLHLAYNGTVDPAVYGVHAVPLMPNERVSGTVIVSAMYLSGQTLDDPNGYHWLLQYPRTAILNHSLHVFEVPDHAALINQGLGELPPEF